MMFCALGSCSASRLAYCVFENSEACGEPIRDTSWSGRECISHCARLFRSCATRSFARWICSPVSIVPALRFIQLSLRSAKSCANLGSGVTNDAPACLGLNWRMSWPVPWYMRCLISLGSRNACRPFSRSSALICSVLGALAMVVRPYWSYGLPRRLLLVLSASA